MRKMFLILCLGTGLGLTSCGTIAKVADGFDKAHQVVEKYGPAIEKVAVSVTELMPKVLEQVDRLQKLYDAYKPQIDQMVPEAAKLLAELQGLAGKAGEVSDELKAAHESAKAKATRADGSTDWWAYLTGLGAALLALLARQKAAAVANVTSASQTQEVDLLHGRVAKRKAEVADLEQRLRKLEEDALRASARAQA